MRGRGGSLFALAFAALLGAVGFAYFHFHAHDGSTATAAFAVTPGARTAERAARLSLPPAGKLYHGVYPGGASGEEDDIVPEDVDAYENAVGARVAWVYFSQNWYRDRAFPLETARWIRDRGAVPFIRLMFRSSADQEMTPRERAFLPDRILSGDFDEDLVRWGRAANDFNSPLIVEYGTECNGEWFPWNARWSGYRAKGAFGAPDAFDGPERFAAAFRRIVTLVRGAGAMNITWVFHVNASDGPAEDWNRLEDYYPGDDVVDWVAVSAYGPQTPVEDEVNRFRDEMDACYARLQAVAPGKPIIVAEFGCTTGNPLAAAGDWAAAALTDLMENRWPNIIGFSWWNERWENDDDRSHDTNMRVQNDAGLAAAFHDQFRRAPDRIQAEPIVGPTMPGPSSPRPPRTD